MGKIKVIIADDSRLMREVIGGMLREEEDIEIIGQAADGRQAVQLCEELNPDILVLDVIMPEMDGIEVLKELRKAHSNTRTIVFSSKTQRFAPITVEALALGAAGYIPKPQSIREEENYNATKQDLLDLVRGLGKLRSRTTQNTQKSRKSALPITQPPETVKAPTEKPAFPEIIVLATSTGGPNALSRLLKSIPNRLSVPLALVQHMPKEFLPQLAERLNKESIHTVKVIEDGEMPEKGVWYIAPGESHSRFVLDKFKRIHFQVFDGPKDAFCLPSANPLFRSAAMLYRNKCHGVVLTGMGYDGLDGSKMIKSLGGTLIIQEKSDSVVWGMPGAVFDAGLADYTMTLEQIGAYLTETIGEVAV